MARSIPIRHGLAIAHAHTIEDAADLMVALQSRSKIQAPSTGLDLSSVAAASAKSCLEAICADIPIEGRAASNFGTALRAGAVRKRLSECRVRNIPILKLLGFIASAADASRHLTAEIMHDTVSALRAELDGGDLAAPPCAEDVAIAHNPVRQPAEKSRPLLTPLRHERQVCWMEEVSTCLHLDEPLAAERRRANEIEEEEKKEEDMDLCMDDEGDSNMMMSQSEEAQPVEKVDSAEEAKAKFTADLQLVLNAVNEVQKETKERTRQIEEEFLGARRSLRGESSKREEEALRTKRSLYARSLKEELSEDGAESLPSTNPPAGAAEGGA